MEYVPMFEKFVISLFEGMQQGIPIESIDVDQIYPEQKDYDRAEGLKWQGRHFHGDGSPFGSEASKMAKLIKDPIKLIRRSKAVVQTYGTAHYRARNHDYTSMSPHPTHSSDRDKDAWTPFREALERMGFSGNQIALIANSQREVGN